MYIDHGYRPSISRKAKTPNCLSLSVPIPTPSALSLQYPKEARKYPVAGVEVIRREVLTTSSCSMCTSFER